MLHRAHEYHQICSHDDPGYGKVKFGPYAFVGRKGKTMDFSETIVVYDLKLATNDRSDKKFPLTSKLCPLGADCPFPGAIYMYKIMKKNV